tara:strand:+ start:367 stop:528 length:162 start_codon:yes stop_codon:yes gene_type:complete
MRAQCARIFYGEKMKYLTMVLALACLAACGDKDDNDTGEDVVDTAEESETAAE